MNLDRPAVRWQFVVFPLVVLGVPLAFVRFGPGWATFVASLLALAAATFAAVLAWSAYKAANRRPNLRLEIETWMAAGPGPYLSFEEGEAQTRRVSSTRPLTEWDLILRNEGTAPARLPVIFIQFSGLYLGEEQVGESWRSVDHSQPYGWTAVEWIGGSDVTVYPGLPLKLPRIILRGAWGYVSVDRPKLSWTLAADGFGPRTTTTEIGTQDDDRKNWPAVSNGDPVRAEQVLGPRRGLSE